MVISQKQQSFAFALLVAVLILTLRQTCTFVADSSIRAYFNLQSLHQANKVGTFRIMIAMIMILDFWMTSLIFLCWFWVLMATGNSGPFERGNCRNHIIMFVHVFPDHFRTLSLALAIFWVYYITPYFLDLMLRYLVTPFSKAKRWFDKHSYSLLLLRIPLRFILALPHALFLFIAQDFVYIFGQTDKVWAQEFFQIRVCSTSFVDMKGGNGLGIAVWDEGQETSRVRLRRPYQM